MNHGKIRQFTKKSEKMLFTWCVILKLIVRRLIETIGDTELKKLKNGMSKIRRGALT